MAELIYLESMDSVRATWLSEDGEKAAAYAQVFVESLLNLALGRNIVVQRSFAFDSLPVQRVVSDLVEAYDSFAASAPIDANRSAPILLHLHGATSFKQAVADTVLRMSGAPLATSPDSAPSAPFQSSMYPELHGHSGLDKVAGEIAKGKPEDFLSLLDPERALLFDRLWKWFGQSRASGSPFEMHRVVAAGGRIGHGIKEMVEPLLDKSASLSVDLDVLGIADLEPVAGIVESLRTLRDCSGSSGTDAYTYRSRLYGNQEWFQSGATAEQIIGVRPLLLVRELINTMYNMVCQDSIGIAAASFTTEMVDPDRLSDQLAAQSLAGLAYDKVTGRGLWRQAMSAGAPQVNVRITGTSETARTAVIEVIGKTQRQAAFRRVLEMREEKKWQATLAALSRARGAADARAFDQALRRHLDVVGQGLSEICEVDTSGGMLQAGLKWIAPAGAVWDTWGTIHDGHRYNATEVASNIGTGMPGVVNALITRRNQRIIKMSLGEIVRASGSGQ